MTTLTEALIATVQDLEKKLNRLECELEECKKEAKPFPVQLNDEDVIKLIKKEAKPFPVQMAKSDIINIINKERLKSPPPKNIGADEINELIDSRINLQYINTLYGKK